VYVKLVARPRRVELLTSRSVVLYPCTRLYYIYGITGKIIRKIKNKKFIKRCVGDLT